MKNLFLRLKRSASNKITNIKNKTKKGAQKFKENFHKAKIKPRSKRESLFLGFTTTLSIFGIGLLVTMLPAVAKDVPKNGVKPGEVSPTPTQKPILAPSQQIISGLSGAAATMCALAVTSGSFMVGAVCGVIVVVGILKAQGK
jgi:hypothetical protein